MEWNGGMDWTGIVEWNGMRRVLDACALVVLYHFSFVVPRALREGGEWPFYLSVSCKYLRSFGERMSGTIDSRILLCDSPPCEGPSRRPVQV